MRAYVFIAGITVQRRESNGTAIETLALE